MKNKLVGAFGARPTVMATELRSEGAQGERIVGRNGELNASGKKDLLFQQQRMMQVANSHNIVTEDQMTQAQKGAAKLARMAAAASLMNEPSKGDRHIAIGAEMGEELYITQQREGIMRSVLQKQEVVNGQVPKVVLRNRNIVVNQATGPTQTHMQIVRDNWMYPVEFYFTARPYIEQIEISRNSTDVLEDKYFEAMQGFMVAEDRLFRHMCLQSVGQANPMTTQVGLMNPVALGSFRDRILSWGLTPVQWLVATDLWTDVVGDVGFQSIMDPVAKHELLLTGVLGTILGMEVKTDAYRHPEWKVIGQGEHYIFGSPDTLGTYTDRGGIQVDPIDAAITSIPGRGWNMYSLQSMTIGNFRAIACGKRVR